MNPGQIIARVIAPVGALTLFTAACMPQAAPVTHLASLADVSIEALRARQYSSTILPVMSLPGPSVSESKLLPAYRSLVASYDSDGNRVYTRIDIPSEPSTGDGYPVVILVHGWYGLDGARDYNFEYDSGSLYTRAIETYTDAGFLVLSPALRGHGTVDGIAAEGIEFLEAWDNGSYISPMFYAIDVLNLVEGLQSLQSIDLKQWGLEHEIRIDPALISISGHSQGGDAALTALAVSGEGSTIKNVFAAGSIYSGCFGPRFEQAEIYGPMATTLEAFMSGDGNWTGSATAIDGTINPNFVFGYPSDWIGTVNTRSEGWTWQAEAWPTSTVAEALEKKYSEMYQAVNRQVGDIDDASFTIETDENGKARVRHDTRIASAMQHIGAYHYEQFLSEPVHFHHSDQDYYSIPRWNADMSSRINQAGGTAVDFTYPQNNHSLLVSDYDWFSHGEVVEGFTYMLERDQALFSGETVTAAEEDLTSIAAVSHYAATVSNEFQTEFVRIPLEGIKRRVVGFSADGLRQYALVLEPAGQAPDNGWPVLLMNHGYHPNPPDNGRVADGSTDRPGDYYRGLPLAFAKDGFLVVVPDYRGHNISEGLEFTQRPRADDWYTRDVIAAFRALPSLALADTSNIFMWGHSMGGNVTLRALLALGNQVRGASLWSSSSGHGDADPGMDLQVLATPLNIHHSADDPVTTASWSATAFENLQSSGKPVKFYSYAAPDHLFLKADLQQAISRDVHFFRDLIEN